MDTMTIETTTTFAQQPTHEGRPVGMQILKAGMDEGYRKMYAYDDRGERELACEMSLALDMVWDLYMARYNEWQARGGQSWDRFFADDPGPLECSCTPRDNGLCPACKVALAALYEDELPY